MLNVFAATGLAAALLAAPLAAQQAAPAPSSVVVDVVTVNGSGCPAGSASVTSVGATGFRISFDGYVAWTGPSAAVTDFRKNCQFSLAIEVPEGWQYAVIQGEQSGFAWLAAGVTAVQRTSYYFQGSSATTAASHTFTGPYAGSWRTTDIVDVASLNYSPCGGGVNLNINTEVRISGGPSATSTNLIAFGEQLTPTVAWRAC